MPNPISTTKIPTAPTSSTTPSHGRQTYILNIGDRSRLGAAETAQDIGCVSTRKTLAIGTTASGHPSDDTRGIDRVASDRMARTVEADRRAGSGVGSSQGQVSTCAPDPAPMAVGTRACDRCSGVLLAVICATGRRIVQSCDLE